MAAALVAASLAPLCAQGVPAPATPQAGLVPDATDTVTQRFVSGRVVRPAGHDIAPVARVWVVLHRVGADTAHPLDSTRTRRDGGFAFHYRRTGRADAIYFVSASYSGIAYFSPPLTSPRVTGADAELTVFDTTSAPLPLQVRGRHIVVGGPNAEGDREVLEVYELANDSSVTIVSSDGSRPTWSAPLPPGARSFQVGRSEISPESVRQEKGQVMAVAPFAPGLKQVTFAYVLGPSAQPLSFSVPTATTVLEVLAEENGVTVGGAKLTPQQDVQLEGRRMHRWLGHDVPATTLTLDLPRVTPASARANYFAWVAVGIGAAMLMALAAAAVRRRPPMTPLAAEPPPDDPERLAQAIARLDADFERRAASGGGERGTYESRRAELKERLAAALAAQKGRG